MTMTDITRQYISGFPLNQSVGTPDSSHLSCSVLSLWDRGSQVQLLITSFKFYVAFVISLLSFYAEGTCVGHVFLVSPYLRYIICQSN